MTYVIAILAFLVGFIAGASVKYKAYNKSKRRGILKKKFIGVGIENKNREFEFTFLVKEIEMLDNGYSRIKILDSNCGSDYKYKTRDIIGGIIKTDKVDWEQ